MKIKQSTSARGSNRGGIGGGYEATNPEYDGDKLRKLRVDHDAMEPHWRETFLAGLSRYERKVVTDRRIEIW